MVLKKVLTLLVIGIFGTNSVIADINLPAYFSDGMVLQQQTNVPLWGYGTPQQNVWISCSWSDTTYDTKINEQGKWEILIKTPKAGGPYTISITSAKKTIHIKDILIGEVWICSGQSNMVFKFSNSSTYNIDKNTMNNPKIRYLEVKRHISDTPKQDIPGSFWQSIKPEAADSLSAVALYFAQKLQQETHIPIGIIEAAWGGTSIDNWTPKNVLKQDPNLAVAIARWETWRDDSKMDSIGYQAQLSAKKSGLIAQSPEMPTSVYINKRPHRKPAALYNGMIAPLTKFKVKGVLWYQGETNRTWSNEYEYQLTTFIDSWRKAWGYDLPFGLVQLAPYKGKAEQVSEIMEAQLNASKKMNDVGIVVTMDVGNMEDIHPTNKKPVGHRLANWALEKVYGHKNIRYSSPIFKDYTLKENTLSLRFDHVFSGFESIDTVLGFDYIAFNKNGTPKKAEPINVTIEGNILVIKNLEIEPPFILRYGWGLNMAEANLFNKEGLPAGSFRVLIK